MTKNTQIKDRKRVVDHGEVFTSEREVNAMLDLVKHEAERIESRFLEPACGNGNFLAEILNRKLAVIVNKYKTSQVEFERYSVIAIGSMYGVDILADNVIECRERLFNIWADSYKKAFKNSYKQECLDSIKYILSKNILWGDALTLKTVCDNEDPIVFPQWSAINGTMIKRCDYTLANLLDYQPMGDDTLFGDLMSDTGNPIIIPPVYKDYSPIHYLKVSDYE
ncbi:MAG: SAM-dependent DNA methyltransferase [Alphaproteobacteria bacterium]